MRLDKSHIAARTVPGNIRNWLRIFPERHKATPCNAGFGSSRFSSPTNAFRVLYAAHDFPTAFAEAVVRDRFEGKQRRYLYRPFLESLVVAEISTAHPLQLLDLTGSAAYEVGVDTDAKGARAHMAGQRFAEALHAQTTVDGILFSSRLTASPCVAIFDKAFAALTAPIPAALPRVPALTDETSRLGITVRRRRGTGRP